MKIQMIIAAIAILTVGNWTIALADTKTETQKDIRIYALNCGDPMEVKDLSFMSDTGHYNGKPGKVAISCFLIRHPKGWLLWDTGLGDRYVGHPGKMAGFPITVSISLESQIKQLGLTPKDITYVGFSHLHADHTGNANLFPDSTWLLQRAESQYALSIPTPLSITPQTFSGHAEAKTHLLDGDYDVFGDGTVRILRTPGHTPGHQSLEVILPQTGVAILSGDLWHQRESYETHQVPVFNTERADTLASFDRIEGILKETHGRLIIQHDYNDFSSLPKIPDYLK